MQWESFKRLAPNADKDPPVLYRTIPVIGIADEVDSLPAASSSVNTKKHIGREFKPLKTLENLTV